MLPTPTEEVIKLKKKLKTMLELINLYLMAEHQCKSAYTSKEEKKALKKSNLKRLERSSQMINWEIMETNNALRHDGNI